MEKTTCFCYIFIYTVLLLNYQMLSISSRLSLATDESALLALKAHITSDPLGIVTGNWTNTSSVCSWIGVTCNRRHHRVSALNVSNMDLVGTIPPQLGNLSFLVSLNLRYNLFSGTLPRELSRLQKLKHVSFYVNNLSGDIPSWFGLLPKLEYLYLRNNSFSGFIPKSLSNLSNLEYLDLSYNSLYGNIPPEFGSIRSLKKMSIQGNHLSGAIPSSLLNLSALEILAFTTNELSGSLPIDLCAKLPFLEGIYLSENQLTGQVPANLSQCSQLRILSLSYNSFSGLIPKEIGMLKFLQHLYLGSNNLYGSIPQEIGNLQNLVQLSIDRNKIAGPLPLSLFNISSLQRLYLSDNKFTGVLPHEIGKLSQMELLSLGSSSFIGSVPPEIYNITSLRVLDFSDNGLSGRLPTNFGYELPLLEQLILYGNQFSGAIPESISNCSKLELLELAYNQFTGFVPQFLGNIRLLKILRLQSNNFRVQPSSTELSFITSLTNCTSLVELNIGDNPLDGAIPASIGNLSTFLQYFHAFNCSIKGAIPSEIGNLSSLVGLDLRYNELSGNIPLTFRHLHSLQELHLRNNSVRDSIPPSLCELPHLYRLFLGQNQFWGQIPECLGNVTTLGYLYLDSNSLSSSIPPSLWQLKDLLQLDLSNNFLSGSLSPAIGNLVAATYINLSMNNMSEYIPTTIGDLQNLAIFSLAHNGLKGSIPASVGSMINLVTLDLSYNSLSGPLPKALEKLQHFKYLNVSFNALTGEIPTGGPFGNFTGDSFKGNPALCGIQRFNVSHCHTVSKRRTSARLALIILSGVSAFMLAAFVTFIFMRYRRKHKGITNGVVALMSIALERISYFELLEATEQFSESNLLGSGSFGSVYRGTFGDGKILAVKVFNLHLQTAFKSFEVECEVLRSIRHRNLTKVVSSCSNEDFKALILEYMPHGSLEKWLYCHNYFLDVMQRLNIMIDVASAVEYLHHGYSSVIVHCDLKPSNVLLDEDMVARVSDFGIAKLLGEDSISHTNTLATMGYIAPEYGLEGLVSTRCDVYSFGVMLMETFTRKRPSDDMFAGDLSLKIWVQHSLPTSPIQVIDANLLNPDEGHFDKNLKCASSVLDLALKCSAESPERRGNMKEVVAKLQRIKCQYLAERV